MLATLALVGGLCAFCDGARAAATARTREHVGFPWSLHPRQYAAYRLQAHEDPIVIDGNLDDDAWERVPFTDAFLDISGPPHWSQPWFATKTKLRYDHDTLRVDLGERVPRNAVIFHDNDLEVFVDPDGSTHNYKEIEVNARNATWNLWLNKPYRSGGHENSTRVDPTHGFDMYSKGFHSAVHVDGPINDPTQRLHYWTVEVALPLQEVTRYTRVAHAPVRHGTVWRINFSRVEWQVRVVTSASGHQHYEKLDAVPESNWVWTPQYAVDMHRPEWWGYLHFRDEPPPPTYAEEPLIQYDHLWPLRLGAFQLFYAQETYKQLHGKYATELDDALERLFPIPAARQLISLQSLTVSSAGDEYEATIAGNTVAGTAVLRSDSLFSITSALELTVE